VKFKSALVTQVSGSIGGMVGSHNRGGMYMRSRAVPVNPATSFQQAVRNQLSTLVTRWSQTLTALQRQGWQDYADNVEVTDTLGDKRKATALDWYVGANTPRVQFGGAIIDAPPTVFTMANLTPPVITSITSTTRVMILTFTNTDLWATLTGGFLGIYISRPQSPGVSFFKGPYRFLDKIVGAASPPTSPFTTVAGPFPLAVGNNVFVQFRAFNADGRYSSPFRLNKITV
jgi:hypothetical protein